jgi:flagellar biosynthesis protein FliQ
LQAATQVQEQTLTLLPKVLIVAALAASFGRFGLQLCSALVRDAVALAPQLVR